MTSTDVFKAAVAEGYWIYIIKNNKSIYAGNDPDIAIENVGGYEECYCTLKKRGAADEHIAIVQTGPDELKMIIIAKVKDKETWLEQWVKANVQGALIL